MTSRNAGDTQPVLHLRSATKVHRTPNIVTTALRGVDLDVSSGEFVAITGASGSGKTTLLGILGLLDRPDTGRYSFDGIDVMGLGAEALTRLRRGRIGYVFQDFNLINHLTVRDNVALPLRYLGHRRPEARARATAILGRLGLEHRAGHRPSQLSGGQQQRVAVARALVVEPAVILADEPTGNLDTESGETLMQLLAELHQRGTTIAMVTHSERDASYAGRHIRLRDGAVDFDSASMATASPFSQAGAGG